jgi:hypothetical protein
MYIGGSAHSWLYEIGSFVLISFYLPESFSLIGDLCAQKGVALFYFSRVPSTLYYYYYCEAALSHSFIIFQNWKKKKPLLRVTWWIVWNIEWEKPPPYSFPGRNWLEATAIGPAGVKEKRTFYWEKKNERMKHSISFPSSLVKWERMN